MGQLARGVEWPADESGVGLCALSLDEAARLLGEVDPASPSRSDDVPISFEGICFEGHFFDDEPREGAPREDELREEVSVESASFDAGDLGDAGVLDEEPPTQRCPRWDPIAQAPSSAADTPALDDASPMGAPPFVRSLLTAW